MDPTACLAHIRELVESIQAGPDDATYDDASELADAVADLDRWMSNGGFPPSQWERQE